MSSIPRGRLPPASLPVAKPGAYRGEPGARRLTIRDAPMSKKALASALLLAAVLSCGCEIHQGKLYIVGTVPVLGATEECQNAGEGRGSMIRVAVLVKSCDPSAPEYGGVSGIAVRWKSSVSGETLVLRTDLDGNADAWVAPGHWRIRAGGGDLRSGRYEVDLPPERACIVTFRLESSHSNPCEIDD